MEEEYAPGPMQETTALTEKHAPRYDGGEGLSGGGPSGGTNPVDGDEDAPEGTASISEVLMSTYVLGNLLLSAVLTFLFPLLFFYFIFILGRVDQHPDGRFAWTANHVVVTLGIGPLVTALAAGASFTLFLTENHAAGRFPLLCKESVARLECCLPCVALSRGCWRFSVVRHLVIGLVASAVLVPSGYCAYIFGYTFNPFGAWATVLPWTTVFVPVLYVTITVPVVIPWCCLGYAVPANYARVARLHAKHVFTEDEEQKPVNFGPAWLRDLANRAAVSAIS